jgi:predicted dehydrogenase
MVMRTAIVGCGLIGHKRARSLGEHRLVAVADTNGARAEQLAGLHPGCTACADWQHVVSRDDVDVVCVAATNQVLAPVTLAAVEKGKHVLVEKPAARNAAELAPVIEAARGAGVMVKVGFNHRFHPAFAKARTIVEAGDLGQLMYVRGRYGHGGRLGYDREWRADPAIAGGGELLDQGVHLIDLARWFLGDFREVQGEIGTFFWNMPVEDNAFLTLKTAQGHVSCTEWKNLFCFEVFGKHGKLQIDGLGGSYGTERLTFYRMLPQMGPPETTIWEYPGPDTSWGVEWAHFVECIQQKRQPNGSLQDALACLAVVRCVYAQVAAGAGRERTGHGQHDLGSAA